MALSVKDVAGALKLDARVVERLARYLYPNKVLLTHDEALVLRDYYYKFGGGPAGAEVGAYNEWMKLERMKALVRARLEMIEEKQNSCVTKLNALAGKGFPATAETMPARVAPVVREQDTILRFPTSKIGAAKPAAEKLTVNSPPAKERRVGFFSRG